MNQTRADRPRDSHASDGVERSSEKDPPDISESDVPIYPSLSTPRKFGLVITLASSGFLNIGIVQSTIIILPSIADSLQASESRQQWIASSYNVAMGCTLLIWGSLADVYGRRSVFILGSAGLAIMTMIPPFIPNEIPFYVLRAMQGVFAAATLPSAIGILSASFPPGRGRNFAVTSHSAVSALGSVVCNIMGGLIGASLTWKWVFWILAMASAVVSFSGFLLIPRTPIVNPEARKRVMIDWLGAALATSGVLMLLIALTEGSSLGWHKAWIPVMIAVSVLILAIFCLWQQYLESRTELEPLVRMSMFSNRHFSSGLGISVSFFCSYQSYMLFATYFYQDYLKLSTIQTTLRFLPGGIAGALTLFITPVALSLIPSFYLLIFAASCGIISPLLFSVPIPPSTTYWAWGFPAMCLCISADILAPVLVLLVMQTLPQRLQSLGAGIISTANQLGRTGGVVLATTVETAVIAKSQSQKTGDSCTSGACFLHGLRAAQWLNTGMAALALVLILCTLYGLRHMRRNN